ncbi:hypothetical protein MSAN_02027000 [Mycena sanguinolenta]|uniref:Uncharacterized protein n=1 Tax=Mycena sanguinolenta TaxID=230812 RepID=A0A8H6XLI2_9AGAR|nr:hypothetical protein MSAN_02027000 [Mycena sanguinolenta]
MTTTTSLRLRPPWSKTAGSKRNHNAMANSESDDEQHPSGTGTTLTVVAANQNIVAATKLYANKKRLRSDQVPELEQFAIDPPSLREVKLFANLLFLGNEVSKSRHCPALTNINKYAPAVLLSSKITTYKGNAATDLLLIILKKYRFDIPPGLEHYLANWAKIVTAVQYALTQRRSKIKKLICASLKPNPDGSYGPEAVHQNIYDLAQATIKDTQCSVSVELCARIALMRKVYLKHPGNNFLDKLDDRLAKIRSVANGDAKKIVRAFRLTLTEDQDKHGAKTYDLDENTVDAFQQQVDELINIGLVDAATSVQGPISPTAGPSAGSSAEGPSA